MIKTVNIKIQAANVNAPLDPIYVLRGSAASFTITDVPRPLGVRAIAGVAVVCTNADGATMSVEAVRVGSAWGATIPADFLEKAGTVENGIAVTATGRDDAGNEALWKLGSGKLLVLDDAKNIVPGEKRDEVDYYPTPPEHPRKGDLTRVAGKFCIWTGQKWTDIGGIDLSDVTLDLNKSQEEINQVIATVVLKCGGNVID